jgi:hypothetical protein
MLPWIVWMACSGKSNDTREASDDSVACTPLSCEDVGAACGDVDDGCGVTLACGTCGWGSSCDDAHTCVPVCESEVALTLSEAYHDYPAVVIGSDGTVGVAAEDAFGARIVYTQPGKGIEEVFASKFSPGLHVAAATAGGITHVVSSFHTNVAYFQYSRRDASGTWTSEAAPYKVYYPSLAITAEEDGGALVSFVPEGSTALLHASRSAGGAWSDAETNPCLKDEALHADAVRAPDGSVAVVLVGHDASALATLDETAWTCADGPALRARGTVALALTVLPDGRAVVASAVHDAVALHVEGDDWAEIDLGKLPDANDIDVGADAEGFVTVAASSYDQTMLVRLDPDAPKKRESSTLVGHATALAIDALGIQHLSFAGPKSTWEYRALCPFAD